jgi:hypothetical protein
MHIFCIPMSDTEMQKTLNLESYVPEVQGSRKHEDEWPSKPGSQSHVWYNTLHPIQQFKTNSQKTVIRDHNGITHPLSSTTTTTTTTTIGANAATICYSPYSYSYSDRNMKVTNKK